MELKTNLLLLLFGAIFVGNIFSILVTCNLINFNLSTGVQSVLFYGNSTMGICMLSVGRVRWNSVSLEHESVMSGAEVRLLIPI